MAEIQSIQFIDYISAFIAKNKSRIKRVIIGVPNKASVRIFMNDGTQRYYEIGKSTRYLYRLYVDSNPPRIVCRGYSWTDILLICLRCDMKPPRLSLRMIPKGDATFIKTIDSRIWTFLSDLDFEEYSPELSQLVLDFIMKNPVYIMDVLNRAFRSVEFVKLVFENEQFSEYDPFTGYQIERTYQTKASLVHDYRTEEELSEISERYLVSFISELKVSRCPILKSKMEELISSEELSPEQKMFFVRYYREH